MNVVLSLVRSAHWTAQKIPFWTYCICLVVYSGSAQNLPHALPLSLKHLVLRRNVEQI